MDIEKPQKQILPNWKKISNNDNEYKFDKKRLEDK